MKLLKCYIENFGTLKEYSCRFDSGLNSIYSKNGTGKTTFTVFIKSMLYGLSDTRKTSLDENDRKKYLPWQGGGFGGSLSFEAHGKRYTVERKFGIKPSDDTFRLINFDTGTESHDFSENLGEELFSIDRDGFERTVFLSEKNLSVRNENKSISAKLSDLVGADADMGEFDSAMKLLDERRKFYYKKGGSGEIGNLKERLLSVEREIERLEELQKQNVIKEDRMSELEKSIKALENKRSSLNGEIENISKNQVLEGYSQQYNGMKDSILREENAISETLRFFGGTVPSADEINSLNNAYTEGVRLKSEVGSNSEVSEELLRLREFFKEDTSFEEIDKMAELARHLKVDEDELDALNNKTDSDSLQQKNMFPVLVPGEKEISKNLNRAKKCGKALSIIVILLGLIIAPFGILFLNKNDTVVYSMIGVGALLTLSGLVSLISKIKTKSKLSKFLLDFPAYSKDMKVSDFLIKMQNDLKMYKFLDEKIAERKDSLSSDINEEKAKIFDFLGKFKNTYENTPCEAISKIRSEYSKYYTLTVSNSNVVSSLSDKEFRSNELLKSVEEFYLEHGISRDVGFDELRSKIIDYNYKIELVKRLKQNAQDFAVSHSIVEGKSYSTDISSDDVKKNVSEIESLIMSKRRELTLIQREYNDNCEKIDKLEEMSAMAEDCKETLKKYSDNLSIIQKTAALLNEASERMNGKYLGKTKENFLKYEKMIDQSNLSVSDFAIDTDFALSKNERGSAKSYESFSRGMRDIYSFAMRLALCDSLYENEKPFIILDDAFISYDDEKCENAKLLLKNIAKDRQILYFTCSKSRAI